ncbi:nuclear transport factor 2 family protein [Streptomyces sp. NPDC086091]|uniref:nuclear transport factor 2 family protein n=1 Tax=Streptomyces sp. NPDC086091 TaxID=3365751 RepID=UPI00381ED3FA
MRDASEDSGHNLWGRSASRRGLMRGAVLGGALATASVLPAGTSLAAGLTDGESPYGGGPVAATHSSAFATALLNRFFRAKSARDPQAAMSFFAPGATTYIDATVGWSFTTWQSLYDLFASYMPNWPASGASYMTRIVGGDTGAIVFFTNAAGVFGSSEIRAAAVVDIRGGRVERWVDYWDGRHFGTAETDALRLPGDQWPADFREKTVGERAHPRMRRTVEALAQALRNGDAAALARLFSADVTFEDLTSHVVVRGRRSAVAYLTGGGQRPPGAAADLVVRHTVGSAVGGGYEWLATSGPVHRGLVALELDRQGAVSRFTSVWDGSLVSASVLTSLAVRAIEE